MDERYTLKQNIYSRASMFTHDELGRQKRLGLNEIDKSVFEGLVSQRTKIEEQQQKIIRSFAISLFLAFVAWNGGDIQIPGTGVSIAELPSFLELSLIAASLGVLMITYTFLSIQIYNAIITAVAEKVLAKNQLDPDIFAASHAPVWLFFKYSQQAPVNGRPPGFKISKWGSLFYKLLVGSGALILLGLWFVSISCIVYIAHSGLSDNIAGWATYCMVIMTVGASFISMAANVISFTHEMDFDILEKMEPMDGDISSEEK